MKTVQLPTFVVLHRSRLQPRFLCVLLAFGVVLIGFYPAPFLVRFFAGILFCIWCGWIFRRLDPEITALELTAEGGVNIRRSGQTNFVAARCLPDATVHPWLTVLRLETRECRRYNLLVTPDCLSAEDFRRLRVFLRWRVDFKAGFDGGDSRLNASRAAVSG